MMETSLQGMMFLLLEELYASLECVHHVSERVFTMSPVYTEGRLAPALVNCHSIKAGASHPSQPEA